MCPECFFLRHHSPRSFESWRETRKEVLVRRSAWQIDNRPRLFVRAPNDSVLLYYVWRSREIQRGLARCKDPRERVSRGWIEPTNIRVALRGSIRFIELSFYAHSSLRTLHFLVARIYCVNFWLRRVFLFRKFRRELLKINFMRLLKNIFLRVSIDSALWLWQALNGSK